MLVLIGGCKEDEEEPEPEPEPESFWLVGEDGMIYGFGIDSGPQSELDEEDSEDLLAITCDGTANAWVVGERGAFLRTTDAGTSWTVGTIGSGASLRAVATRDGETVISAGDDGAAFVSVDGGRSWGRLSGPDRNWRSVAPGRAGAWLVVAARGEIWSVSPDGSFTELHRTGGETLHAIDTLGTEVVVAGDAGLVLRSVDGGETWQTVPRPTDADLYAVDIVDENQGFVAAGAGGVIVRGEVGETRVVRSADHEAVLALHVSSAGHGAAVGEAGTFLTTEDGGDSWVTHDLGIDGDLHGLDQPFRAH